MLLQSGDLSLHAYPGRRFAAVPLRSAPGGYVGARWAEETLQCRPANEFTPVRWCWRSGVRTAVRCDGGRMGPIRLRGCMGRFAVPA